MGKTRFEYDIAKSHANRDKYGIDFDEALALWKDSNLVCLPSTVKTDELRLLFIGQIKSKHWTAIAAAPAEYTP